MEHELSQMVDQRIKSIEYVECMYVTEDDKYMLFHYMPRSAGTEDGIMSISRDNGYNRLDVKFHFIDAELQVMEIAR